MGICVWFALVAILRRKRFGLRPCICSITLAIAPQATNHRSDSTKFRSFPPPLLLRAAAGGICSGMRRIPTQSLWIVRRFHRPPRRVCPRRSLRLLARSMRGASTRSRPSLGEITSGQPSPPNSPSISYGDAQKCRPSPMVKADNVE
jgi:hypothetical protein